MAKNEGKTTFILGAGAGLGLLLCSQLLKDGRTVLAMMSPGEESQYLKKNYPEAYHAYFQESMEPKAISEQIRKIIEEYPEVDELILMDGYRMYGALEEASELEINHSLQYNLIAPLYVCKAFLPHFREKRKGKILSIMSEDALLSKAGHSLSNVARFGLLGAYRSLQEEMEPFGVKISIICLGELHVRPEPTDTRIASLTRIYDQGDSHSFLMELKSRKKNGPVDPEKAVKRIIKVLEKEDSSSLIVLGSQAKQSYYDQNEKTNRTLLQEEGLSQDADITPSRRRKKSKKTSNDNPLFRPGRRKKGD